MARGDTIFFASGSATAPAASSNFGAFDAAAGAGVAAGTGAVAATAEDCWLGLGPGGGPTPGGGADIRRVRRAGRPRPTRSAALKWLRQI